MKYESYDIVTRAKDLSSFDFMSKSNYRSYLMRIAFVPTRNAKVFQLIFGNLVAENEIDDISVNDNGDRNKILATIADAVNKYTKRYPARWIYFAGSSKSRTRLYRLAIGLNLEELSLTFDIYARTPNGMVPFSKNMEATEFYVRRKSFNYPFTTI